MRRCSRRFFQYGVALHDLEVERIVAGETTLGDEARDARGHLAQGRAARRSRTTCCSRCWPGRSFPFVLAGNATANLIRNLWAFTIIFCGHFPDGTQEFTEEETEDETRGDWYFRQMLGSANLDRRQAVPHPGRAT